MQRQISTHLSAGRDAFEHTEEDEQPRGEDGQRYPAVHGAAYFYFRWDVQRFTVPEICGRRGKLVERRGFKMHFVRFFLIILHRFRSFSLSLRLLITNLLRILQMNTEALSGHRRSLFNITQVSLQRGRMQGPLIGKTGFLMLTIFAYKNKYNWL